MRGGDYGALGALIGGLLPGYGGMLASTAGEVAGSMSFKEAEALLVVTDTRTGVQVAVVQGSAKARDLGGNLELGSLTVFAAFAGYSNTLDHRGDFFGQAL